MPKKGEKVKNPNPAQDEAEDDSVFTPKGIFSEDFIRLCRKEGLYEIPIVLRHRLQEDKPGSSNGTNHDVTAYKLVSNKEYTSPRIEVEYEDDLDLSTLKHFYFRRYKLSTQLLHILATCFPFCPQLHSISLWNVALSETTLSELARVTAGLSSLKRLILDGNPIPDGDFSALLSQEKSVVETLSLRGCGISSSQCTAIGNALRKNKSLTFFDLSNNHLDDDSGIAVVKGLRTNRTLHALSLAGNSLTDVTVEFLANSVLQEFPLTHEEIVERRTLVFSSLAADNPHRREVVDSPNKLGTNQGTPSPVPDETRLRASGIKTTVSSKNLPRDDKSAKNIEKPKSKHVDSARKRAGSKMAKRPQEQTDSDKQEVFEYANPLLEKVSMREKQIFIPGNMTLLSLNLSYNLVSVRSLSSLLAAVVWQSKEPNNAYKPGLLKVSLKNNLFSEQEPVCIELHSLVAKQDPLYVPPVAASESEMTGK